MKKENDYTITVFIIAFLLAMVLMHYAFPYANKWGQKEIAEMEKRVELYKNECDESMGCDVCEACEVAPECETCKNDIEYIPVKDEQVSKDLEVCESDKRLIDLALTNCRVETDNLMKKNDDCKAYSDEVYMKLKECEDKYPW